jgi:hypothetical protein
MVTRKGITTILSTGALVMGVTSAQPAVAKEAAPQELKVEFDASGRVGVSDKELLQKLRLPTGENAARFDLRLPDGVQMSGPKQNMVCRIIPPGK